MPDIADDHANFRDAMRRAEEASGITRDAEGNEVYADVETPVVTPELQDAVPVQASDQPLTPEPVVSSAEEELADTSGQQQEEVPAVPTLEEVLAERDKLLAQVEEQKQMIGRQSTEVGEVRQEIASLREQFTQAQQAPQTQEPLVPITHELIATDPVTATQLAFKQGNEQALSVAWNAWAEEDPLAASSWRTDRLIEAERARYEQQLAERDKRLEEVAAPVQQQVQDDAVTEAWTQAFNHVEEQHPGFIKEAERLLKEAKGKFDYLLPALESGDPLQISGALSAMYQLDSAYRTVAEEAQAEAAEAAAARAAAGAVSGQHTAGQPGVEKTAEELEQERYITRQRSKPSLSVGWTGRS